ncbi:hypothetical protein [Streptomyces yaizuensis]|uniref:VWA domain-containing protein n=1 Tax=Streptomyces yaizuensis TaxID=2989713 RepID=A0ABQ5NYW0_9ACTN|nr:hypothetical protein [Streptomyces sp. YSPA8]GLF95422.1 hypothetical protein SYYSPA8_14015 [Streptomyces sp. YSPA8]
MSGDIWFGDLARALGLAATGDRERQRTIAALLGFASRGLPDPGPGSAAAVGGELVEAAGEQTTVPVETEAAPDGRETADDTAVAPQAGASAGTAPPRLLVPVAQEPPPVAEWRAAALPAAPAVRGAALPYEPLLARRSSAALVQTAVARVVADGGPDVPRIVRRLARGLALTGVPLRPVSTLRFGVQILVDLGAGTEPFARDQRELADQVRAVVGRERTRVRYFEDAPLRGAGAEARWSWGPYTPPTRGTRVLVLSDLGLGGPAPHPRRSTRAEWEDFTRLLARAGCGVTAFVPCPPHRIPAWAGAAMEVVPWDRHTTVGQVRGRLRPPGTC